LRVFIKYSIKKWKLVKFSYALGGQKQSSASDPSSIKTELHQLEKRILNV